MRFSDHAARKKLSKKEKSLIDKPWIDFYLRHLMRVRDTSFKKYCRAEKSNIHAEYKVLRNEVKLETKQAKKIITRIYSKNLKQIYQRLRKPFAILSMWEEKVNVFHAS